jgi:hypothetical protein
MNTQILQAVPLRCTLSIAEMRDIVNAFRKKHPECWPLRDQLAYNNRMIDREKSRLAAAKYRASIQVHVCENCRYGPQEVCAYKNRPRLATGRCLCWRRRQDAP